MKGTDNGEGKTNGLYWRSLDELAQRAPENAGELEDEFPGGISAATSVSRRGFLSLMSASLAIAGLNGCVRRPEEYILPYSKAPEDVIPGIPSYYATAWGLAGHGMGLLVETHEGRPTKIEGNPSHPVSRGASDTYAQASVLELYDPDRSTRFVNNGKAADRAAFLDMIRSRASTLRSRRGRGLRFLSEASSSPTLGGLEKQLAERYPEASWHTFESISEQNVQSATELAFGESSLRAVYRLERAEVILALDSDFLLTEPNSVLHAGQFAGGRRVAAPGERMNRLYSVEGIFSVTGAMADHRLAIRSAEIGGFARALAAKLLFGHGVPAPSGVKRQLSAHREPGEHSAWITELAADLYRARGRGAILVGLRQPAAIHALAHMLNVGLGNIGNTVLFVDASGAAEKREDATAALEGALAGEGAPASADGGGRAEAAADHEAAGVGPGNAVLEAPGCVEEACASKRIRRPLNDLLDAMAAGEVDTLVILGGNPVYGMPAGAGFRERLKKVSTTIYLSLFEDETAKQCTWCVPRAHYLETWSDVRSVDGTASIVQPLIEPLYGGLSDLELAALFLGNTWARGYDLVREYWKLELGAAGFERAWRRMLHDGVVEGSRYPRATPRLSDESLERGLLSASAPGEASASALELIFLQDPKVYDGRFANNGWLQEMPDPMTKLTWDNAALVSPATAKALGVGNGDVVSLSSGGERLEAPVWQVPGQADHTVGLALGWGREAAGRVGNGRGVNANLLRTVEAAWFTSGVTAKKTGRSVVLATTQEHGRMYGRPIIREGTLEEYNASPEFAREMVEHPPLESVFKEHEYSGQQWGMAVDLNVCTGCSSCVVACQAENNIPIVGKEHVLEGREMHWMRLDRYFVGDEGVPRAVQQPVFCQHCENAPCEPVCPVAATVHAHDGGTNDMVYNRCIGTRYCSNNCPYKVRRFNFFNYHLEYEEVEKIRHNPDVTIRFRGVMEKCTYCLQRINGARREAKLAGKKEIEDGAIMPACAQVCPTGAIVFGDINDPGSRVAQWKARPQNYQMLSELNVKPRTSYLARFRNPNPKLS